MEYPKFEPGKSLPTNINIAITAMPVGEHRPATQQPAPAPARTAPAKAEEEPLPEGWASAKAPDGRTYYYHKTTKKTQWTRPTDITPIK